MKIYIYIYINESLCYTAEINTLNQLYSTKICLKKDNTDYTMWK